MLKEQVMQPSSLPWRTQVFVAKDKRHKPKIVVDYSHTVNPYTVLDTYPLPNINEQINEVT